MTDGKDNRTGGKELVFSSIIGVAVSVLAGILSNVFTFGLSKVDLGFRHDIAGFSIDVHWTIWAAIGISLYILGCYVIESRRQDSPFLRRVFRVPLWSDLRAFGEQPAARASYWALIIIPIIAYISKLEFPWLTISFSPLPLNFKLAYFASWFLAISLITFAVFCPKDLRRKNPLEKVKTVNLVLNNVEHPSIIVEQGEEVVHEELDRSSLGVRTVCFGFYMLGTVAVLAILVRSANVVLNA